MLPARSLGFSTGCPIALQPCVPGRPGLAMSYLGQPPSARQRPSSCSSAPQLAAFGNIGFAYLCARGSQGLSDRVRTDIPFAGIASCRAMHMRIRSDRHPLGSVVFLTRTPELALRSCDGFAAGAFLGGDAHGMMELDIIRGPRCRGRERGGGGGAQHPKPTRSTGVRGLPQLSTVSQYR